MDEHMTDQFPALRGRMQQPANLQRVDHVRRVLWRAFKQGALSEEEFATTLDRLEFTTSALEPSLSKNEN